MVLKLMDFQFGPVPPPSDVFGAYTFVIENNCGRDVAMTRIIHEGLCLFEKYECSAQYSLFGIYT